MPLRASGRWPGPIRLWSGLGLATARPWNAEVPEAHLRLVRGGRAFLRDCTEHLLADGAPAVVSPPLSPGALPLWSWSGYRRYLSLDLLERPLGDRPPAPAHVVERAGRADWGEVLRIDGAAFDRRWQLDRAGLEESLAAARSGALLVVRGREGLRGFAVVGRTHRVGYLQRLAVDPAARRRGVGRSLLRAGLGWAAASGATRMLLNTESGNRAALALYGDEGFRLLPAGLALVRVEAGGVGVSPAPIRSAVGAP